MFLYINRSIPIAEEAESFNREWVSRTRRVDRGAIEGANPATARNVRVNPDPRQLALPSTTDPSARLVSQYGTVKIHVIR